jgi:biotin carboxylase
MTLPTTSSANSHSAAPRRRLAVAYDDGAVRPIEIYATLRELADLVFVPTASRHATEQIPVMEACGQVVPAEQPNGVSGAVKELREANVGGIVTYSERCLPLACRLATALDLPHHSPDVLANLTNKAVQRQRLRESGVDPTASAEVFSAAQLLDEISARGGQAVVKPSNLGGGSRHTYRVQGEKEARTLADELFDEAGPIGEQSYLVEELLVGAHTDGIADYISIETVVTPGSITHLATTGKFPLATPFRETGQFWPARLADGVQSRVQDLASAAIKALGVERGVLHTEVKLTTGGPRIIEVNGRLGGHIEELCTRAGVESAVLIAAKIALGVAVDVHEIAPRRVYWQHNAVAPRTPCTFRQVTGVADTLASEGISQYRAYVSAGDALEGGVQTQMIDILCGEAQTHASMLEDLHRARSKLTFSFEFADGTREVPARALEAL